MAEKSAVLERVLRGFGPEPLGVRMHRGRRYSEVAEFMGVLVNGRWRPVPQGTGALYRTLPATRLFFGGDKLALQDGETGDMPRSSTSASTPTRWSRAS